jgi:hypothetical protein
MLLTTILVAALLFLVAMVVLADACRPLLRLRLNEASSNNQQDPPRLPESFAVHPLIASPRLTLSDEDRDGFTRVWDSIRERFDTDPTVTVVHADLLMSDLIEDCSGSAKETDGESGVLARLQLKNRYSSAHEIAARTKEGLVKPSELERAMGLYAVLFDELLGMG